MRVRAFQGLAPAPEAAAKIAAVPYDVVNRQEAAALAEGNPLSLLHVDRAEIDLPPDTDPYGDAVYETAAENFRRMQDEGALVREGRPVVYLYRQVMGDHVQTGIAAVCHIDDYANDVIRKHEKTRPAKENDRVRLVSALSANTGPIFLTYRDRAEIERLVANVTESQPPRYDVTAPDGVRHIVWRIDEPEEIEAAFAAVAVAYVADGHHRSASAWRVGMERRQQNPNHTGDEDYNWFLCVLFPASQLSILPYNRAVADLGGRSAQEFLAEVAARFDVSETDRRVPNAPGQVCLYLDGSWRRLAWSPDPDASPIEALDVSVLQSRLLEPVLGIRDPRTDDRIDFIGGIRGPDELERLVNSGKAAAAFSMFPVTVDQLIAIADAGEIMPPKSTWFEPKLRSGFFIHTF